MEKRDVIVPYAFRGLPERKILITYDQNFYKRPISMKHRSELSLHEIFLVIFDASFN